MKKFRRKFKLDEKDIKTIRKTLEIMGNEIKKAEAKKNQRKLAYHKTNLINFILGVKEYGIVVEFDKEDGRGKVGTRGLQKLDIWKLYNNYAMEIIKQTEKEINRRREIEVTNKKSVQTNSSNSEAKEDVTV